MMGPTCFCEGLEHQQGCPYFSDGPPTSAASEADLTPEQRKVWRKEALDEQYSWGDSINNPPNRILALLDALDAAEAEKATAWAAAKELAEHIEQLLAEKAKLISERDNARRVATHYQREMKAMQADEHQQEVWHRAEAAEARLEAVSELLTQAERDRDIYAQRLADRTDEVVRQRVELGKAEARLARLDDPALQMPLREALGSTLAVDAEADQDETRGLDPESRHR